MSQWSRWNVEIIVNGPNGRTCLVALQDEENDENPMYTLIGAPLDRETLVLLAQGVMMDIATEEERRDIE